MHGSKAPPFTPISCMCTLLEILDTDEQPQWADTLHDPKPEAEDYAPDEVPENLREKPEPIATIPPQLPALPPLPTLEQEPAPPVKPRRKPEPEREPVQQREPESQPKPVPVIPDVLKPTPLVPAKLPLSAPTPSHPNPEIARAIDIAVKQGVPVKVIDQYSDAIKLFRIAVDEVPGAYSPGTDVILINPHAKAWTDPQWLKNSKASGWLATDHPDQTIRHEIGHYKHLHNLKEGVEEFNSWKEVPVRRKLKDQIRREISQYATSNVQEFVAETYSALVNRQSISAEILEYYDKVGGARP
jgi:hypothetical protein